MLKRLFVGTLILLPVIEIALFIQIGGRIGLGPTLAWLLLSALVGIGLIRVQGVAITGHLLAAAAQGRLPARDVAYSLLAGIAGLLLIIPGFFSDFLALLLLLPMVRRGLLKAMFPPPSPEPHGGRIIEGEFRRDD